MARLVLRTLRLLTRPLSRPAALFLAWTHRYTVALWWRSMRDEFGQQIALGRPNVARWRHLLTSLWRVSSDARLANAPELRRLAIDGVGVTVDADHTWHGRYLLDTRLGLTVLAPTMAERQVVVTSVDLGANDADGMFANQR